MIEHFTVESFRRLFPIFENRGGVYLDSAATTLTPHCVVEAQMRYYDVERATVGRSTYRAASAISRTVEQVRENITRHINLPSVGVIVFCSGATMALNMAAMAYPWSSGDNVVSTLLEHHSNMLPWMALRNRGVEVRLARPLPDGTLHVKTIMDLLDSQTQIIAVTHVSNVLGISPPVADICAEARRREILCVVDGAQAFGHIAIDLTALGCDIYAASAHKGFGPTGMGMLALSSRALERLTPPLVGGGMVETVEEGYFLPKAVPFGWEAGTPHVAGIIGWGASLPVLSMGVSPPALQHVEELSSILIEELKKIHNVHIVGPGGLVPCHGIVSFAVSGMGPHRVGSMLDELFGIMVRSGQHCAMPLHREVLQLPRGSVRVSLSPYNTLEEIEIFLEAMRRIVEVRSANSRFDR